MTLQRSRIRWRKVSTIPNAELVPIIINIAKNAIAHRLDPGSWVRIAGYTTKTRSGP